MKGFPNQLSNLTKLATGIRVLVELVNSQRNGRDDGLFGSALVMAQVAGTGHQPMPPGEYLRKQESRPTSQQSHRTTARGLRELYRMLGFIDDTGQAVRILPLGREAAALATQPLNEESEESEESRRFWHNAFWNLRHEDSNGTSHPYRVLLRLVARKPRISRAKCALALEAKNDSVDELNRISALADLEEDQIVAAIDVTRSNWENARKVLPAVAQQLRSIRLKQGHAELTHHGFVGTLPAQDPVTTRVTTAGRPPRPVTPTTIARVRTDAESNEGQGIMEHSPPDTVRATRLRGERLRRHQAIVRRLAQPLHRSGARLYEDPFDILAVFGDSVFVFEVKTLDGDQADERERVREALAQLCYYEMFDVARVTERPTCHKVACFEGAISEDHRRFLRQYGITVIWEAGETFVGDPLPRNLRLGRQGD